MNALLTRIADVAYRRTGRVVLCGSSAMIAIIGIGSVAGRRVQGGLQHAGLGVEGRQQI